VLKAQVLKAQDFFTNLTGISIIHKFILKFKHAWKNTIDSHRDTNPFPHSLTTDKLHKTKKQTQRSRNGEIQKRQKQ